MDPERAIPQYPRLGMDNEGNPHWLALEEQGYENPLIGLRGFHRIVCAGDHGGNREHAVVGQRADFRLEVTCDHVAKFAEGVTLLTGAVNQSFRRISSTSCPSPQPA